jgi:hypothetical protein
LKIANSPGRVRAGCSSIGSSPPTAEKWALIRCSAGNGPKARGSCFVAKSLLRRVAQEVGTAIETEATLVDQPLKTELEYRIIAINESGDGSPSNTIMVVL